MAKIRFPTSCRHFSKIPPERWTSCHKSILHSQVITRINLLNFIIIWKRNEFLQSSNQESQDRLSHLRIIPAEAVNNKQGYHAAITDQIRLKRSDERYKFAVFIRILGICQCFFVKLYRSVSSSPLHCGMKCSSIAFVFIVMAKKQHSAFLILGLRKTSYIKNFTLKFSWHRRASTNCFVVF